MRVTSRAGWIRRRRCRRRLSVFLAATARSGAAIGPDSVAGCPPATGGGIGAAVCVGPVAGAGDVARPGSVAEAGAVVGACAATRDALGDARRSPARGHVANRCSETGDMRLLLADAPVGGSYRRDAPTVTTREAGRRAASAASPAHASVPGGSHSS